MTFSYKTLIIFATISGLLARCGDQFMAKTGSSERSALLSLKTDAVGNVSSIVTGDGGTVVATDGTVSFPPGALSTSTSVIVGPGQSLATTSVATELGIANNSFTSAGNALAVISSQGNPAISSPMTISVGYSPAALNLTGNELYNIIFRATQSNGRKIVGIIPSSSLNFKSNMVHFQAYFWGVYQLVKAAAPIALPIVKDSLTAPSLKADPSISAPSLTGSWYGACVQSGFSSSGASVVSKGRTVAMVFNSDLTFVRIESEYLTTDCSGIAAHGVKILGTFKTSGKYGSGFAIDFTFSSLSEVYTEPTMLSGANQSARCGSTNWAINVAKDTSNCPGDSKSIQLNPNLFTIYSIDPTGAVFRFGADNNQPNSSAASRPTDLSTDASSNLIKK